MIVGRALVTLATLLAALIVSACSGSNELADGSHVVDGYMIRDERPCSADASPALCEVAIATATKVLRDKEPAAVIVGAIEASPGCKKPRPCIYAGLSKPELVVFDLSDGSRRVVGLWCSGPVSQEDGTLVQAARCEPNELSGLRPVTP